MDPVHVGTIVRSRGRHGEVAVICPSGRPERLLEQSELLLESAEAGAPPEARAVRRAWVHGGRLILHLEGADDIGTAEALRGRRLFLSADALPELPEGEYYTFQLEGLQVTDPQGGPLGRVAGVGSTPAHDLLEVQTPAGLRSVPMVHAMVREIDLTGGRIVVDAPDGLLTGEPDTDEGPPT